MHAHTLTWTRSLLPIAALASGCVIGEKLPGVSGGEGSSSGSEGSSSSLGASTTGVATTELDPTGAGATTDASTGATTGEPAPSTGEPGSSGAFATTTGDETGEFPVECTAPVLPPDHDEVCGADTAVGSEPGDWNEFGALFDPAAFATFQCPWDHTVCTDAPLPGVKSAFIVRNGDLPAPIEWMPPTGFWAVMSNVELGCGDPFGAPLCEGEWRIAWPLRAEDYCEVVDDWGSLGIGSDNVANRVLIAHGDAACVVHEGVPGPRDLLVLRFPDCPAGGPMKANLCGQCEIPGVAESPNGDVMFELCP